MAPPYADTQIAIFETLRDDPTLSTLTGKTVSDPRVYQFYPEVDESSASDAIGKLSSSQPAYLIFNELGNIPPGEGPIGEDQLFQVQCVARDPASRKSIIARLREILQEWHSHGEVDYTAGRIHLEGGVVETGEAGLGPNDEYIQSIRFRVVTIKT